MSRPPVIAHAFTLIEVLLALALSLVILLMAVTAVRTAYQVMREIRSLAEENDRLVDGWFLASNDVDFWHSHADPEFPYLKGPMSDAVTMAGSTNNPYDKRPFRRLEFTAETAPLELPHQSPSWYRGGLVTGVMPLGRMAPEWKLAVQWQTVRDASAAVIYQEKDLFQMPAGWAPWHLQGDYASIANVTLPGAQATQWRLFKQLGHLGVAAYMPPGTVNLISRPATNRTVANIGNPVRYYDWGEIPWALATGAAGNPAAFSPVEMQVPSTAEEPDNSRGNYLLGMLSTGKSMEFRWNNEDPGKVPLSHSRPSNDRSGAIKFWATDLDAALGRERYRDTDLRTSVGFLLPSRALTAEDGSWDATPLIDGVVIDPLRLLTDDGATLNNVRSGDRGLISEERMRRRFMVNTWHVPQAASDADPDLDSHPPDQTMLRTGIYRTRTAGGDRVQVTIAVQGARGRRIELGTRMLGTDYRGARMHWGWKTSRDRTDLKPMGDVYVP